MFKRIPKAVLASLFIVVLLMSLAACGKSEEKAQPQDQQQESVSTAAPEANQPETSQGQEQQANDTFNPYAPYAGETIVVSWPSLSHFEKAKKLIPQFEKETGIKVEVDSIQYMNMRDKQVLEMSKPMGQGGYDVVSWVIFNKTEFVNKGYLTELAPFFTDARLADPDYDPEDLVPAYLKSGSAVGGRRGYLSGPMDAVYGVPFGAETSIMAYRKDIFEENNLKVPTTYDEMLDVASYITENVDGVYGMTSRGSSNHHIVHAWLLHASPYGASIFDDHWNVTVDSPEAKAATKTLKAIIDNSPPGVTSWGFGEEANAFLQGESAIYVDSLKIAAMSRDPEQSLVDGKVGFALHPTGPAGCGSETGGFAMGIPNNSAHKEAAFLFIQWMTSKRVDRMIAEVGGDPVRMSTLADPELQASHPEYPVILEQLKCANEDWRPLIPEWGQINAPIMGVNLGEYVNGEVDLDTALSNAKSQIQDVMARAGYYTTKEERYKPYAGETIVVSWPSLSHFEKAKKLIPEFEKETGIKVEVDSIQYMNMRDKQVLEMSKPMGQGGYDVVSWVIFNKTEFVNKGYLTELAPFFTDARLADPDYDPEDLVPAYLKSGSAVGGRRGYLSGPMDAVYGVPFGAETSIMAYRKDIFEENNLKVPTTYDEMLDVASYITENVDGVYGMTSRGSSNHHIVHAWLLHASPYGASIFDDHWNVTVDSPEAKAATKTLKAIIDNSPPGVTSWGFGEEANAFLQGESAIYVDSLKIAAMSRDPEQSLVDGKVGFALHPTGPAGCGSETGGFAMGIPNNSAHKEAAFLFIQWMTSKEGDRKVVEAGGDPVRMSTLADPELQTRFPEYPVILEQLKCANEDWRPLIPEWGQINAPIMGVNLGEYVNEQVDLDTALSNAKSQIQDVMERAGYYTWSNYTPPQ